MIKSNTTTIRKVLNEKILRISTVLFLNILSVLPMVGQAPSWVATTPSIGTVGPLTIPVNYGINMAGTVYIICFNYDYLTTPTSSGVKTEALAGPSGSKVATAVLPVAGGDIGIILQKVLDVINPNRLHTIFIVAESSGGTLQATPTKLQATTLPCPSIYVETGFNNTDRCVNGGGADKIYTLHTYSGYDGKYSNILKGATWRISWGDGPPATDYTYTSTYDNDGPGGVLLPGWESLGVTHAYTVHDSCYRRAVLTVKNPGACATVGAQTERKDVLLAGRDWDADGNGYQLLVNDADNSADTIKVCEGTEAFITLRDDGEWDCDYDFKIYPPGEPNSNARNVQYVYGMHPQTQAVENTITGNVSITGTYPGTANTTAGHASGIYNLNPSPVENPQQTSDLITIPNTAVFGQYMHVYFKNWNKCNPYSGPANMWDGSAVWDSIVIYIIDAPPAPTAPDRTICFGDSPVLTVTSPPVGGVFKWYKNADKTGYLASGASFDPSADDPGFVTPGVNTYYVSDGQLTGFLCEGPVEMVVLTINPLPTITTGGTMGTVCYNAGAQTTTLVYTATTNNPNFYRIDWTTAGITDQGWTAFAFAPVGGTINTIAVSAGATPGVKNGTMYIRNANGCINTQAVTLTINPLPTITTTGTMGGVCYSAGAQTTTLVYTATTNSPNEYQIDWTTAGITDQGWTAYAFAGGGGTINNIAVSAGATTGVKNGTMYIRNANGCINTQAVTLTINPLPTITTGGTMGAACYSAGAQTTTLVYTATTNSPTQYMVDWTTAGITDQGWTAFAFAGGGGTINNIAISAGATTGVKNGTMTIRTAAGCTATQAVTLTINPLPTITTGGTMAAVCYSAGAQTTTLVYTATTNNPNEYRVDWTTAGITDQGWTAFAFAPGGGTINTISISGGATFGVKNGTMYIRNANGCINTQAVTVTINPFPTITTGGTIGAVCYNAGAQVTTLVYTATTSSPIEYMIDWTTAGITDQGWTAFAFAPGGGTINNIAVSAGATTGVKSGTMSIRTANGCINTQAVTLTINPLPTITTGGTMGAACYSAGAQTTTLVYTATTNSPTEYMVDWTTAGITDQGWTAYAFAGGGGTINNIAISAGATTGVKNGTMTIRTAAGCTATQAVTLTINPLPTITTGGTMAAVCYSAGAQTTTLVYTATTNNPNEYRIDWTTGGISDQGWTAFAFAPGGGTINTISISGGATFGVKNGTMYIRNANGCINTQAVTVTINPFPTITTGGTIGAVCYNAGAQVTTLVYTATTSSPIEYMIDWTTAGITDQGWTAFAFAPGGGTINNIAVSAGATTGVKNGTMSIRTANGCINTQAVTLTINPLPTITTGGTMGAACYSAGAQTTTLVYTATTNSPTQYMVDWTTAGITDQGWTAYAFAGGGGTINTIAINAGATAGVKNGTMTIRTAAGCIATQAVTVTINPLPTPSISGLTDVCAGQAGVNYTTAATGNQFDWTISGGIITAGTGTNQITVTWGAAGAGYVYVRETIVATGCNVTTPNYNVTINPGSPAAAPTFTSGQTEICLNGTLNLNVSDVAAAAQYIWDYSWVAGTNNATTAVSQIDIDLTGRPKGTYTVTVQAANGCGAGPWMAPVHSFDINDIPDLTAAGANPCSDVATGITFSITNFDAAYCSGITYNITNINNGGLTASAGAPATGTGFAANVIADDAWTNTTGGDVNVVYTVVPVSTQGCTGTAETVTVTVKSEPLGWNATLTTCSDVALAYNLQTSVINVVPGNSQPSTFTWVAAANPFVTGESTVVQTTGIINDNLNNVTGVNQTVVYTVTPTGTNLCAGNSFTVTVTVKPEPVITAGQNVPVCSGNPLNYEILLDNFADPITDGVTFTWPLPVLNPVDPGFTGGTARVAPSSLNITDTYTNIIGGIGTATYTITPYKDGCTGNPVTLVITVGSEPVLDPGLNKFACSNETIGLVLKEAAGSVVPSHYNIISVTYNPGDLTANGGNAVIPQAVANANYLTNDIYINNTTSNKQVVYRVQPVLAPDCFGDPVDVTITVYSPLVAGTISTTKTSVCYGTDAPLISNAGVATGGNGTYTYSWYYTENLAAVPGDAFWTLIPGETGSGYDPGNLINPTKYIRRVQDTYCAAVGWSNMLQFLIDPLPVTSNIVGEDKLCDNAVNKVYQVTNHVGSTYAWTTPAALVTKTFDANMYFIMVDAVPAASGTDNIQVIETITATGCVGVPKTKAVTVSPVLPGEDILGDAVVCTGETNVRYYIENRDGTEGSTYVWTVPAGASITTDPSAYEIFVTFNLQVAPATISATETTVGGCTTIHNPLSITINPLPTVYNLTAPVAYCAGDPGVTITLSNSQTGVNYQLFRNAAPEDAPLAGNTGSALTWNNKTTGTYYVVATNAATACSQQMNGTIVPAVNLIDGGMIGTDHTICENSSPNPLTNVASATGGGSITYQWQESNDNVTYNNIVGATSAIYTPGVLTADRYFKRIGYSTMGTSVCSDESNVVLVTVNNFIPGSISADQDICEGALPAAFTSVAPSGDGASYIYQWKSSTDGISYTNITGATSETYSPVALTADTWFKRAVTSILGGNTCTEETNAVKVTVINFAPGSIAADQTICEGSVPTPFTSVAASGDGAFTYQWQSSIDGVSFAGIIGATSPTYAPGALTADTWYKRITTSTVGLTACDEESNVIKVTVNNFDPGAIGSDQTICEGTAPVAFTSTTPTGDGAFTYQWQSSIDGTTYSNIPGATNETYSSLAISQDTWFRRRVTSTLGGNSCAEFTTAIIVTVNNFIPGSISGVQTICEGGTPAALTSVAPAGDGIFTYQWQSSTDGVSYGDIAGATLETYSPGALVADTWYKRQVKSTLGANECTEETNSVKITVNNFDPGSIGSNQTICESTAPSALTSVTPTGDGTFAYKWYSSPDGATWTLIGGAVSETYSPGFLTADTWYYREVTSTLNAVQCVENTNSVRITVNNMLPGAITADQTICDGAVPAAFGSTAASGDGTITYQWQESLNGIAFSDIAGATSETFTAPTLTQDTWYRRLATSTSGANTCTEESNMVRVTVINFLPGSIGSDQTICEATAPVAFTSVAASGDGTKAYQWQSSPDNATWTDIGGATSATYTSPALSADTYFRRTAVSTLNTIPCTLYSNTVLVTVNNFDPGTIGSDQDICEDDVPAALTSTLDASGDGTITYQWQTSTDGTNFNNITGATISVYAPGALTADTWFRRRATSTLNANQCIEYTAAVKITVNNFTPGSVSAAQTICEGDTPAGLTSVAPSGDGAFTLQWQESPDGTAFTDIGGATLASYNPGPLAADTWYRIKVTSVLGTSTCVEYTNAVRISVNNLDPGSVGSDQTICENTAPAPLTSISPTGDGTITYKWYSSPDGAAWSVIAGAISETYTPGVLAADTYYRREVTSTLNGKQCIEVTNAVVITVNNMLPGSISADQTICESAVPAALTSLAASGDGIITYLWKDSPDGIAFTDIPLATAETYAPAALTADTWYKRSATSTVGIQTCTGESNVIRITVINFSAGSIGNDQTICEATAPAPFTSVAAGGDGIKTYQWQSSPDGLAWSGIAGATSATYTSPALSADTYFRRMVTATLNTVPCIMYTNTILVTVNNFDPGSISADQTICEDDAPAAFTSVTPTGDGTITYQWQSSTDGISFVSITGATSETYTSGPLTSDTWFRRQVTSTLNGTACIEYTVSVKVTVNNFTPGSIAAAQTICEGGTPAPLTAVAPAGDGSFTFQWQNSSDGVAFADIAGETGAAITPPALVADTWYRRNVTSTLGLNTCSESTNSVRITVNNLDPGSIGSDQTICENTAPNPLTSVTPSGDGAFTYHWFISTDGVTYALIAGIVTETYSPGVLAADTWYKREVTSTLNGVPCSEETNAVRITVNNFLPGSISADQTICEGIAPAAFTSVAPSGDGSSYSYQWKSSVDGVAFNDIAGATSETYASAALSVDTWFKRVVTSTLGANTCTEETNAVKVTVINFAPGSIAADQTICENTAPAMFTGVSPSGDGAFTYQWQNSLDGIAFTDIPGATGATYAAPALTVDTWYRRRVTATLNATSCTEETNSIKVTINSLAPGISTADQTICEGGIPATLNSTPPTGSGTLTYQWQSSTDGINFSNITGAVADSYTSGALTQDTWFRLAVTSTLNGNSCTEVTNIVKVTVNNFNAGTISADQTICEGDTPAAFTSVDPTGDGTFTYQWQSSIDNITWTNIGGATSVTYTSAPLTVDTWFRRVVTSTLNAVSCVKETAAVKVTVNNFVPGSISSNQTICEGSIPVPLTSVTPTGDGSFTYRWFSSTDGISFSVIAGAIYETYSPGTLTQDTWYKREVTSTLNAKACVEETNTIKITVNNFVPGSIAGDQTICEGIVPAALTSVAPSGDGASYSYQWKYSTDGVNFLTITGATSDTYAPGALNQDTWYKRAVTSTLGTNTCTEETNIVKVTVNNVNAGTIISDQTICIGSDPVTFWSVVHGTGDGAITYQWQSSTDNVTFTDISGADAANYDAPAISVDTWYKRITKSTLSGVECTKESNVVKITVNIVNGGIIAGDQTICFGTTPVPFTSTDDGSGTGSTVSYQWLRSDNNVIFSTIPGATLNTYTPGVHYVDTYYKRTIISIQNGILCTAESNTIKITINPLPIAVLSGGATICPGGSSVLKVEMMAGTGPFELDIENHGTVTGYISNTDITVTPAATTTYKLLRVRDANGCEINSPNASLIGTATVIVRTLPAITTSLVSKTICEFNAVTFTVAATGSDLTYQWYVNEGSGFNPVTDGGVYFGAANTTLNIFGATRTMSGNVYHAVATGCATNVTSGDATLTVNTPPEIQLHPTDSTICMMQNAAFAVTATGTSLVYQWQVNKGTGFVNVVNDANFSGATAATMNITGAQASFNNYIFRVIITGTCGAPVYSNFAVLRVYTPPTVNLHPANKKLCDGGGPVTFVANGTGVIDSLRWQVYSGGVWSDIYDGTVYSGTSSQQLTLSNVPLALNGNQYRLGFKAKCTTVYSNAATLTVNSNPVVDFSALDPLAACGNVPVVINGNPTGGSGTYSSHLWTGDVGPLNNYFIKSPTFRSQIASTYVLNYKVTDSNGCYDSDDLTVNVDAPSADFTQDVMSGCTPQTVNFTKDMGSLAKFWWDFKDGSPVDSVNASPTHVFTNMNPASIEYYDVKLRVMSAGGCNDEFESKVTIYPAIDAAFTASTIIVCSGESITFTSAPGASKYFWEFGDGSSGYSPTGSTSHLYTNFTTAPVTQTVKLTTTSFYNCSDEATMMITVMPVPIPQFSAVPPTQIFNASGNPVTFTNETNAGTWTYQWRFGDGMTSTNQNPVHTYTALGTYNVTLVVSNANCSDSVMHEVRVLPPPPVADFDSIPSGCEPWPITFNNTSLNTDVPGTTYRWDFGDGSYSTARNPDYTWFDEGSYRVELTVTGPGGTSTRSQLVHVYPSPKAYFEVSPDYVFVNDEKVRCYNHSEDADSYLWEFGDGDTSKLEEPFHKYMKEGIFDITLWAYSDNGCTDVYVLSPAVKVEPAGELRFATVFQPNLDGPIEIDKIPEGGDEVDQFFYPPIREKVIKYKLQIFNRLGVLIFESRDINKPWNGYYKNKLCPQGVYVWYVEGKYANGEPFKKVGDVTLLH